MPVGVLGILAVGYVLGRPILLAARPDLAIFEFPVGLVVIALLLWLALRRGARPTPPPEWRKHEQVVRQLDDPAAAPLATTIHDYIETGQGADEAARVLAHAVVREPSQREKARARILTTLSSASSRRKRENAIRDQLDQGA